MMRFVSTRFSMVILIIGFVLQSTFFVLPQNAYAQVPPTTGDTIGGSTSGSSSGGIGSQEGNVGLISGAAGVALSCAFNGGLGNLIDQTFNGMANNIIDTSFDNSVPVADSEVKKSQDETVDQTREANKKERCLDKAARFAVIRLMDEFTYATVQWINSGYKGDPFYIEDFGGYLGGIAEAEFEGIIRFVNTGDSPFREIIVDALLGSSLNTLRDNYAYSLNAALGSNSLEDFQGSFGVGGWAAFNLMAKPQNNPFGYYFQIQNELGYRLYGTDLTASASANIEIPHINGGFLSWKECRLSQAQSEGLANSNYEDPYKDGYIFSDAYYNSGELTLDDKKHICVKSEVETPGGVAADLITLPIRTPLRQLELADEVNENLTLIANAALLQLVDKTYQDLAGTSSDPNSDDYGAFAGQLENPGNPGGTTQNDVNTPVLEALQGNVIPNLEIYIAKIQTYLADLNVYYQEAVDLDYCIPGPNPAWQTNASQNLNNKLAEITYPSTNVSEQDIQETYVDMLFDITGLEVNPSGFLESPYQLSNVVNNIFSQYLLTVTTHFNEITNSPLFSQAENHFLVIPGYDQQVQSFLNELEDKESLLNDLYIIESNLNEIGSSDPSVPGVQEQINLFEALSGGFIGETDLNEISSLETLTEIRAEQAHELVVECQATSFGVNERLGYPTPPSIPLTETVTFKNGMNIGDNQEIDLSSFGFDVLNIPDVSVFESFIETY
jgi:hypothetical protein